MKKLLLICTLCITALLTNAQQKAAPVGFYNYVNAQDKVILAAYNQKNYTQAVALSMDWLSTYDKQTDAVKTNYKGRTVNVYYNLACFTALLGKQDESLTWLKKSLAVGFNDYANIGADSDLVSLHNNSDFKTIVQQLHDKFDYGYILKSPGAYDHIRAAGYPRFSYQSSSAPELANFRAKFNLDSVSGNGDEISKFKNLLFWAHNVVRHDGSSNNPPNRNAMDLIAVCKKDDRGVNCRMMATILKDAYQAEGFKARLVTCMPKDTADFDCHVITVVWSKTLNKWVWMDPTFNAYLRDEKGNYLSIEEVRERFINGSPVVINDDANWNNRNKETKEMYFGYMSKNLYWIKCATKSDWDLETHKDGQALIEYIDLFPGGFSTIHQPIKTGNGATEYATNNPDYFWQKPAGE